jgi:hypothetical protein
MQIKKDARKGISVQTFLNVIMKPIYAFFYKLLNRGGTLDVTIVQRSFYANLKWAWNGTNLNYLPLSPLIRIDENLPRISMG